MSGAGAPEGSPPPRRRESFDREAANYDRYRRPYPAEVIDDLVASAGIGPGSRVLEIGCGTGQLSLPVARLGAELQAVELGPSLAAIARRHLAPYPRAAVHVAAFEAWPLPPRPFDAVVCATAFHWLDPAVRVAKVAAALRPGGTLAIVATHHVEGGTVELSRASQRHYVEAGLAEDESFRPPAADEVPPCYPEIDADAAFAGVERHRHAGERRFTAVEYVGLLRTDSLVSTVPPGPRARFLEAIGRLIDERFGGEVARAYVFELLLARRRDGRAP